LIISETFGVVDVGFFGGLDVGCWMGEGKEMLFQPSFEFS